MNTEIKLAVPELKEALGGLGRVIGRGRSLPVLQTIRISRDGQGVVRLQATDQETFLTYTTREPQEGPGVDVLVGADPLTRASRCSRDEVGILPEAGGKVRIRCNMAGNLVEQTIATPGVESFPVAPVMRDPGVGLEPRFGRALKEALECSGGDAGRRILGGACLDVNDSRFHYVVGTNGKVLFAANSFSFPLTKPVIIPGSKFLGWSDFLEGEQGRLSVEPGAEEGSAGWVRLETDRWSYVTREIAGVYPDWKQCVPGKSGKWTQINLGDEVVAQLLLVIPNLPGGTMVNRPVRLRVDGGLFAEGRAGMEEPWVGVPVDGAGITGLPVSICLNRDYLLKGLQFGLNRIEIQDPLTPLVMSKGGRKLVIMPVRGGEDVEPAREPAQEPAEEPISQKPAVEQSPVAEVPVEPPVASPAEKVTATKGLVELADQIRESLRGTLRELGTLIDTVKQAEREKRASDREIESIRAKLRQIRSVSL